jgi:hypothetical protein
MPLWEAFWRAILCNVLVCLAVWMAAAGRSVTDTSVAIVPPLMPAASRTARSVGCELVQRRCREGIGRSSAHRALALQVQGGV